MAAYRSALCACFIVALATLASAQAVTPKKQLTPEVSRQLNRTSGAALSADGVWMGYMLTPGAEASPEVPVPAAEPQAPSRKLFLTNLETKATHTEDGASSFRFSPCGNWVVITKSPPPRTPPAAAPSVPAAKPAEPQAAPAASEPKSEVKPTTEPQQEVPESQATKTPSEIVPPVPAAVPEPAPISVPEAEGPKAAPAQEEPAPAKTAPAAPPVEAGGATPQPETGTPKPAASTAGEPTGEPRRAGTAPEERARREGGSRGRRGMRPGGAQEEPRRSGAPGATAPTPASPVGTAPAAAPSETTPSEPTERGFRSRGSKIDLRNLETGAVRTIDGVEEFHFVNDGQELLLILGATEDACGLYRLDLQGNLQGELTPLVKGKGRLNSFSSEDKGAFFSFWTDLVDPPVQPPTPAAESAASIAPPSPVTEPQTAAEPAAVAEPAPAAEPAVAAKPTPEPVIVAEPAATTESSAVATNKPQAPPTPPAAAPWRLMTYDPKERALKELYSTVSKGIPDGMEPVTGTVLFAPDKRRIYLPFRKKSEASSPSDATAPSPVASPGLPGPRGAAAPGGRPRGGRTGAAPSGPTNREGQPVDPATAGVEVWHFTDAEVVTMRGRGGGRFGANNARLLHEVDLETMNVRALESERLRGFTLNQNREFALVSDDQPYRALRTWDRDYRDWFLVNLASGERRVLARKSPSSIRWIADGQFLVWQVDDEWMLLDPRDSEPVHLLAETPIPRIRDAEGQPDRTAVHFLLPDGQHLLFQDGLDLWAIPTNGSPGRCLTRTGRRDGIRYEPLVFDSEKPISDEGVLWLTSWNRRTMARGVSKLHMESLTLDRCMVADRNVSTPIKAKNADRALVTLEAADCPPDLWLAEGGFSKLKRVTETNAWLNEYAIPKSELITWTSSDGEELKGIVTFPPDHQWDTRPLPTIVYIYEELSQGLHRFSLPGLQMSPARWATEGYVVFQPDITYQIGRPGASSVKCVVPGVQKLIDRGITDKDRVGLCGHSWGGYQTAYIITQTRLFAAAISGAPVVNMTSAYNGIRWSTGLPRQFQYERTQSRIGGSLWEYPERFIENSPVFHLENVTTPVLIMFGNNDGAVPWYQGIEYYLAMRRLNKEAVFLEYKGEDHGLRRRPNQEDYTKRISDWFGHYLKGHPKADWMLGSTAPEPLPPLKGRGAERPEVDQTQANAGGAKG